MAAAASLDLESSLTDGSSIRVALLPVGSTDGAHFRSLASLLHPLTSLDLFAITHGQRRGTLRLRFLEVGGGPSDWDDLHSQRRVRAVVGLCHSPSEANLSDAFRAFMGRVQEFPSTAQVRCFVFDPPESADNLGGLDKLPASDARRIVVVPPKGREEVGMYVERLLEDLGGELLRDLKAEGETSLTALPTTPIDSSSSLERSPMYRMLSSTASTRTSGRQQKRRADFMMLTVQYAEAKASYERAIELLSQKGADAVWHAAALEGSASASVLLAKAALTHNSARSMATTTMGGADGGGVAEGGGSLLDASAAYDEALSSAERRLSSHLQYARQRAGGRLRLR